MFKIFIIGLITSIVGAPRSNPNRDVQVIQIERALNDDSSYKVSYELSDGQIRSEYGERKQIGNEQPIVSKGGYSFVAPNGQRHWVQYSADENGYRARTGIGVPPNDESVSRFEIRKPVRLPINDDEDGSGSGFMPFSDDEE